MQHRIMLMTASALATLVMSSGAAFAQDDQSATLEEIVVTAQKREQRLQDVPISISAVTGDEISKRGATSLIDLVYSVPGVSATEYGPGQERIQMRGVSNTLGLATVGRYLDEMPINIDAQGLGLDLRLIDMERIEILRGPQGTLYGEGSMGGTVRYLTANPNLSRFGADLEAQVGAVTDGGTSWRANAVLNLPLVEDRVGLRLVAGYEKQAGWIDSVTTGQDDVNEVNTSTVRGKLLVKFSENIEASLLVMHQENDQDAQNFAVNRKSTALLPEYSNQRYDLVNGVVRLDLGWADLVNSAGWVKLKTDSVYDISGFYVPVLTAPPPFGFGLPVGFITTVGLGGVGEHRIYTDELRLSSKPGGAIDWTVGLYGRDYKSVGLSTTTTAPGDIGFPLIAAVGVTTSKSWSAFGEIDWHATDKLTLAVGLRWFNDKRGTNSVSTNFGFTTTDRDSDTFTSLNPRFNAAYEFSPVSMVYFNAAKGFRSGGFNAAASGGGFPIPLSYDPETLWTYEVGTKQQWFDRKLIFEGSIYYNDWKDVQSSLFAPGSAFTVVLNGGAVKGWGVDLSLTARPVAGLTLTGTYGWNNMEYKTATLDKIVGDPVDFAVRESWSMSADYRRPLFGDVKGFARVDYQHAGEAKITLRNFATFVSIDPRDMFNARLGLDFGQFEVSLFADNLTDEDAPLIPGPFGVISQNVEQRPRTVGVNIKASF
jgi:iron complex outermembrane receptor protein